MSGTIDRKPFPPEGLEGGCTCRHALPAEIEAAFRPCVPHCTWCQRETGSAFVMNALIETERVELIAGDVDIVETPTKSGKGQKVARCPHCRVTLWSYYPMAGKALRFVRVGTADNPALMPPDIHIFTSTKQPRGSCRKASPSCQVITSWKRNGRRKASRVGRRCGKGNERMRIRA